MCNEVSLSFTDDQPPGCVYPEKIEEFVLSILKDRNYSNWDVSVVICDNDFIHKLNKEYRDIDEPTDVLSFEQGDEYFDENDQKRFNAGDIIISLDRLRYNSEEFNVGMNEEFKRLLVHGILHLSGMDHSDNSPEQEMLILQEDLLSHYEDVIIYQE